MYNDSAIVFKLTLFYLNSFVEQGRNPDKFTQDFVERAATENQFTNGKIKAVSVSVWKLFWPW